MQSQEFVALFNWPTCETSRAQFSQPIKMHVCLSSSFKFSGLIQRCLCLKELLHSISFPGVTFIIWEIFTEETKNSWGMYFKELSNLKWINLRRYCCVGKAHFFRRIILMSTMDLQGSVFLHTMALLNSFRPCQAWDLRYRALACIWLSSRAWEEQENKWDLTFF